MIRLKHLSGSLQGRTAELAKPVLRIGRAPDCDVRFDQARDPKVSNHHAELLLEEGNWFVVDTASTNDTLINGRRVTKHRLASGDKLQEGVAGLLAPLPPEEASRGDARVRAQGAGRRHRQHECAEVRTRGDEGRK